MGNRDTALLVVGDRELGQEPDWPLISAQNHEQK